jgi:hypothetical protein
MSRDGGNKLSGNECKDGTYRFQGTNKREVTARFDGGVITSDAGALLLREVDRAGEMIKKFARCFRDDRNPDLIEHTVEELVGQRVYAIALGYEDLNDHDDLRRDPLLATLAGKLDPTGKTRRRKRDQGKPLAGKSTLNRLELTPLEADEESRRYKKIVYDGEEIDRYLVETYLDAHPETPDRIVLDLDATDDPIYGGQEGRFFHGYYGCYCYLPLYVFCGDDLLCARLRESNLDASYGSVEELERIVGQIRQRWPGVSIVIRGDSGFAREELMAWCGDHEVGYVLGLARNDRLLKEIEAELKEAEVLYQESGQASRVYKDFRYRTLTSWSRPRRVVGKAEHLSKGSNPRFVVTSLSEEVYDARTLYEKEYCGRGDMENRIKEQQLYLFSDRTSTETMRANQLRLWFSSVAYVLLNALRRVGLKGTSWARAQCQTIRLKLLKIGAQVHVSVRRIWVSMAAGYPYEDLFAQVYTNLRMFRPMRC